VVDEHGPPTGIARLVDLQDAAVAASDLNHGARTLAAGYRPAMDPVYFPDPEAWRAWLELHAATTPEVLVGFHKRATGRPSLTWAASVDEALCFGWIDGVRRRVDEDRYTIRFTPRRAESIWSAVNVRRVAELRGEGRMTEAGERAFADRRPDRTAVYSHEQATPVVLAPEAEQALKDGGGWTYWSDRAPSYRRAAAHWLTSAKREETRVRRLEQLIAACRAGEDVKPLRRR
jgi:uncharacterized protein YdeI (YjbR/CyaY-like superfamily)